MTVSSFRPQPAPQIPEWDMYDRLNKSLKYSQISVAEAARYFGVHRNTISGYLHGRIKPDTRSLRLWAVMTNVPYEWIIDGIDPDAPVTGGAPRAPIPADQSLLRGSNSGQFAYLVSSQPAETTETTPARANLKVVK